MSRHSFVASVRVPRPRASSVLAATAAATLVTSYSNVAWAQETAQQEVLQEITVTGSRIARRDLDSASPVVTVEDQIFEESSTLAVESVLNQLPQFTPANTQFVTSDTFASATNTPGISTISLRGLGANRTLVLIDGRRGQPANSTLVIDTNSIPASALESVEIITGGASAVYGADALGGVANFKLRKNFEGLDLQYRAGITEEGDGEEQRISMLLGANLGAGRGNAMLGVEWTERGEVMAMDRDFYRRALTDSSTNAAASARLRGFQYEPNVSTQNGSSPTQVAAFQAQANNLFATERGGMNVPISTAFLFNDDGSLFKIERRGMGFNEFSGSNTERYKIGPNGQLVENNLDLRYSSPLTRYSLFGKAHFAVTDSIEAFTTVNFVNSKTKQVLQPSGAVGGFGASIPYGSDLYGPSRAADGTTLPEYRAGGSRGLNCPATGGCTNSQAFPVTPELAALLDARGANVYPTTNRQFDPTTGVEIPTQGVNSRWLLGATLDFIPPRTVVNDTNLYQLLGGFRGDVGLRDWTWEAYYSHGATNTDLDYIGFVSTRRLQAVAQSPNYGRGLTATGLGSSSVSCTSGLPVFGGAVTQDCIDAITANYADRTRLTQDIAEATVQGGLFELPAGELRAALGVTYRKNDFEYFPDATREANSVIDIPVGLFAQANVVGSTRVQEAYGELLVPLVKDVFLVRNLELELGYRYSDYDIAGSVPTWKALFSWQPIDFLRVRGGYQKANRAPNINELFLESSSTAVTMRGAEYCRSDTRELTGNNANNPNRAAAQALCEAIIGNTTSVFSTNPSGYLGGRGDGVILESVSGNLNLKNEDGETWTLGTVLTSPFDTPLLARTTLAVDWYRAKITNAIAALTAQTAYDLCFNRNGSSNPTYSIDGANGICRTIQRDAISGAALFVDSTFNNVGVVETSGVDLALNWSAAFADMGLPSLPGSLGLNVSFNKTFEFKSQESADSKPLENVGTLGPLSPGARPALFDWRLVTTLRYVHLGWDVGLNWRHLPSIKSFNYVTDRSTTVKGADSYDVFALTGNWSITDRFAISGGIDNLFNTDPERVGAGQVFTIAPFSGGGSTVTNGSGTTSAGYYDVLGRRFFVNAKVSF
jgi:iron complex outermembrane receptor protein